MRSLIELPAQAFRAKTPSTRICQMKVHAAVWHFAETDGNKYAKKYARKRKTLNATDRASSDSKWLRNHGGTRIREAWKALSPSTRARLMQETPDDTFPVLSEGIIDERTKSTPKPAPVAMSSAVRSKFKMKSSSPPGSALATPVLSAASMDEVTWDSATTPENGPTTDSGLPQNEDKTITHLKAVLVRHRSKYYDVVCTEEELRIKTAYNNGSLAGVIEAMASGVKNAIFLAHSRDRCQSSTDAFEAVCLRVGDVLISALANTSFPPEPEYSSDAPSSAFASGRINLAWNRYQSSLRELREALAKNGVDEDPDPPFLAAAHPAFASKTKH